MVVIGVVGRKRSGKDTFFNVAGEKFERVGIADEIKYFCSRLLDIEPRYFFWDELKDVVLKEFGMSPREITIKIGNFCRDLFGDTFWIKKLTVRGDVIVTDVRFPHEVEFLLNEYNDVQLYYIDADKRLPPMKDTDDISERAVYDVVEKFAGRIIKIDNNKNLESYEKQLKELFNDV
jgi:hypothetical protein